VAVIGVDATGDAGRSGDPSPAIFGQQGTKGLVSPQRFSVLLQIACRTNVYSATSVCSSGKIPRQFETEREMVLGLHEL